MKKLKSPSVVFDYLSKIFGGDKNDAESKQSTRFLKDINTTSLLQSQDDFENHIAKVISKQSVVSAGCVELLSLDNIHEAMGRKFNNYKEVINKVVSEAIKRRLSDLDVFTRYGELNYVIIFTGLDKRQAQLKIALIAKEISLKLLGDDQYEKFVNVKSLSVKADGTAHFKATPTIETLVKAFETSAAVKEKQHIDKSVKADTHIDLSDVQFVFVPMWNVKHSAITTFTCVPVALDLDGGLTAKGEDIRAEANTELLFNLDLLCVEKVSQEHRRLLKIRRPAILSIQVHFSTLANKAQREILVERAKQMPAGAHNRTIFEVLSLPEGIPDSRLSELIWPLKPISRSIIGCFSLHRRHFLGYHAAGLHAVGYDLSIELGSEKSINREMDQFVASANKMSLKTYVHGIRSSSLNMAAISSGFDYLDGQSLAAATDEVSGVTPLSLYDLYRHPD